MELFGLTLAVLVTMIPGGAYTALAIWGFRRWPTSKRLALLVSYVVASLLILELALLATLGAKNAFSYLGHGYTALHFSVFLLAPPAIAILVIHFTQKKETKQWLQFVAAACCCWIACMSALLGNIMVDEAIMGVDAGKPFYMSKATPNKPTRSNSP